MTELPGRRAEQRASDADRDVVAGDLRDAFSEGRLEPDEYQHRLDAVWEARTHGQLDRLTADLPQPLQRQQAKVEEAETQAVAEQKKRELVEYLSEWKAWLGGAVIMIGIWAISSVSSGELRNFWPGIPLGIWAVVLIAGALGGGSCDKKQRRGPD